MARKKAARRSSGSRRRRARPARVRRTRVARPKRTVTRRPKAARRASTRRRASAPRAAGATNAIGLLVHHMDYTSHALDEVRRFYGELLGFSGTHLDADHNYLTVMTGGGSSLGFMPPMPGPPEQWRPPREPALYFIVADVDRAHRDLVAKGVAFEHEPRDMEWGHRIAMLKDPEGRTVCLAQILRR